MPLKIHHPKKNAKHQQKLIIIQGKCDKRREGGRHPRQRRRPAGAGPEAHQQRQAVGLPLQGPGERHLQVHDHADQQPGGQGGGRFCSQAGAPGRRYAALGDCPRRRRGGWASSFTPMALPRKRSPPSSSAAAANTANGTVTQQPDTDGNWTGQLDGIDSFPNGSSNLYQLNVSNGGGTTTVNNLIIAPP